MPCVQEEVRLRFADDGDIIGTERTQASVVLSSVPIQTLLDMTDKQVAAPVKSHAPVEPAIDVPLNTLEKLTEVHVLTPHDRSLYKPTAQSTIHQQIGELKQTPARYPSDSCNHLHDGLFQVQYPSSTTSDLMQGAVWQKLLCLHRQDGRPIKVNGTIETCKFSESSNSNQIRAQRCKVQLA